MTDDKISYSNLELSGCYNDVARDQTIHNYVKVANHYITNIKRNDILTSGANRPMCLYGTRTDTLRRLTDWINNIEGSESNTAFLMGAAGTGKSTIATTIAESYRLKNQLGCCIFFLREKSDPTAVIQAIADNLAEFDVSIAHVFHTESQRYSDFASATLDSQFKILLQKPLLRVSTHKQYPTLIVLDAIDECGTSQSRKALLRVFEAGLNTLPSNFRFLITGRPEEDIMPFAASIPFVINLDKLPDENRKDVCSYLNYEFNIMKRNGTLVLPGDWPWERNMKKLEDAADGLFIWASTAVKYIEQKRNNRVDYLEELILNKSLDLDQLYHTILEKALEWDKYTKANFPNVFSLISFGRELLSDKDIDNILDLREGTTAAMLNCLRPLFLFEVGEKIRIHHASFYDYLVTRSEGKDWHIDVNERKKVIVNNCFKRMESFLRFNICNLRTSFIPNEEVFAIQSRIKESIPTHMKYICCNWAHHLHDTLYSQDLNIQLRSFAYCKLLFWFEVLSLTRTFNDHVGTALAYAIKWLEGKDKTLSAFLRNAYLQASIFSEPISKSTPHIYCSFLPLTQTESVVSKHYMVYASPFAQVEYVGDKARSARFKAIDIEYTLSSISFSPDGTRIVCGSKFGTIYVLDVMSGKEITGPLVHSGAILTVTFSPDGKLIASGSQDKTIQVWNTGNGDLVQGPLRRHEDCVTSVAFSPDGKYIASGSDDGFIILWDVESGQVAGIPLNGGIGGIKAVSYSPSGQILVSGSAEGLILLWNLRTNEIKTSPAIEKSGPIISIAFSTDEKEVVSCSADGGIRSWNVSTGKIVELLHEGDKKSMRAAAHLTDRHHILTLYGDREIRLWDIMDTEKPAKWFYGSRLCQCIAVAPDGSWFVSGSDREIEIWDVADGVTETKLYKGQSRISSVSVSQSGRYVASGSKDYTICLWDAKSGELVSGPWKKHTDEVNSVVFSNDEKFIASGSDDGTVILWGGVGDETCKVLRGHTGRVKSVAFVPKDAHRAIHIASGSEDGTILIWRARSLKYREPSLDGLEVGPLKDWGAKTSAVYSVASSPSGNEIVSGSGDGIVRIWSTDDGHLISRLEGHSEWVRSVAYSYDGSMIVSGSDDFDNLIRIWDAKTYESIGEPINGHEDFVTSVRFSSDGKQILSGSMDETICLWDVDTRRLLSRRHTTEEVRSISYSSDNKYFVTGSRDGTIRIWSLDDHPNDMVWYRQKRDGWVVTKKDELLMWIPPDLRNKILSVGIANMLNCPFYAKLDFMGSYNGDMWAPRPICTSSLN